MDYGDVLADVPADGVYRWCYVQGLKHVPIGWVQSACAAHGKVLKKKHVENYWNGWYRSDLNDDHGLFELTSRASRAASCSVQEFLDMGYLDFPLSPYDGLPPIKNKWVPCSKENKPLFKWGGRALPLSEAVAYRNQVYLAENLKGTQQIVIDCDGDHGDRLDIETISFLWQFHDQTHCLMKQKQVQEYEGYEATGMSMPASFHLTFWTDRIIPTKHFPEANVDILGNKENGLRYWKTKKWNGMQPMPMDGYVWQEITDYLRYRKEREAHEHELVGPAAIRSK